MTASALAHLAAEALAIGGGALGRLALEAQVRVPATLVRWWVDPWSALPSGRDQTLQTGIAAGGACLLLYAAWAHATHRAAAGQVRALATAGFGFLLNAFASASLRAHGVVGPVTSLVGAAMVFRASMALVRERAEARDAEARGARRKPPIG